jgi:hypothetical protein
MKLVLQDGEIFPDTIVDHFTISSTSVMHLGVANDLKYYSICTHSAPRLCQSTETHRIHGQREQQLRTNYIQALDDDSDILIRGPTTENMKTRYRSSSFQNDDTMTAPNTVVDTSFTSTALDHVLHVGKGFQNRCHIVHP